MNNKKFIKNWQGFTLMRNIRENLISVKGFTLIELLVVISIIGILATLIMANLNEARARARDSHLKQDLNQLQTALQLYYNDFKGFPATGSGLNFKACGATGDIACSPGGQFSAGSPLNIYMNYLPPNSSGGNFEFKYYPCNSGDSYRVKVGLENPSDLDITTSQARCPPNTCALPVPPGGNPAYIATDYIICP